MIIIHALPGLGIEGIEQKFRDNIFRLVPHFYYFAQAFWQIVVFMVIGTFGAD